MMMSLGGLLERQVERYQDKPFLTWYDDDRGERVELSYKTFANWLAKTANLLVEDANGNIVYATTADTSAGSHSFLWNGQNLAGTTSADGAYSLAVVAADATGKAINATVTATGKVDGVSVDNSVPTFDVGGVKVPMSDLLTVQPSSN